MNSKKFDPSAWDAWRRSEFEKHGNDPDGWIRIAGNLLVTASIIGVTACNGTRVMLRNVLYGGPATDKPRTEEEEKLVSYSMKTHSPRFMLYSFAVECLLKALWLSRGGLLNIDGRYKSPKRLEKSHNLLEIAEALSCVDIFDEPQRDLLDRLSAYNEGGRYPTHGRYDHYGIQPPRPEGVNRSYISWGTDDTLCLHTVLAVLYLELGLQIPSEAETLKEEYRVVQSAYGQPVLG